MLDRKTIYERWLEFALALADVYEITPKRKKLLKTEIKSFITMYSPENQNYSDKPILGWDTKPKDWMCIGDHAHEFFERYEVTDKHGDFVGKFSNQLLSCIRAGLDVAVPDMCGGGVVGFTIGDVRKAYGDDIPKWLNEVLELRGDEPAEEGIWL